MIFKLGSRYTRQEICAALGGELQTFLPQNNGRIVCACLKLHLNPQVPKEILIGKAPKVVQKAKILCRQDGNIPVFEKLEVGQWEYKGRFRVKDHSVDSSFLRRKEQEANRKELVMVIYLERVGD